MGNCKAHDRIDVNQNMSNNGTQNDILLKTLVKIKTAPTKKKPKKQQKQKPDTHVILKSFEEFIIKYNKSNCIRNDSINNNNIDLSDHRRVVFVSLIGLYRTWRDCPPYILYASLLIIPLKRDWIYSPIKYKQELQASVLGESTLFQTEEESLTQFIELLIWKDTQGFVFWMKGDYMESTHSLSLIHPFWRFVSDRLYNLYDPVTRRKYNRINEETIRKNIQDNGCKFDVTIDAIMADLYFLTMEYRTIQEVIYQCNPNSLNPITSYDINSMNIQNNTNIVTINLDGSDIANWWISSDYDPYDIDQVDINYDINI